MGQVLRSARTTEAVRRAIQHSQESLRALARCYGDRAEDPTSTVPTLEEEAVIVAIRRHTLPLERLPLRAAADNPASDAVVSAPLPAASRHHRLPEVDGER